MKSFLVTKPSLNWSESSLFKYTERNIQYCTPTLLSVHYSEGVSEFFVKHMQVSIEDIIIFEGTLLSTLSSGFEFDFFHLFRIGITV